MDYNARNRPYLSKMNNIINAPKVSINAPLKTVNVSNFLFKCNNTAQQNAPSGSYFCGISIDYVEENPDIIITVFNTSNNSVAATYSVSQRQNVNFPVSSNQYVTVETKFSLSNCSYFQCNSSGICPPCPTISQAPNNYKWELHFSDLSYKGINQFNVFGSLCCYKWSRDGCILNSQCAKLTSAEEILGTLTLPNKSVKNITPTLL